MIIVRLMGGLGNQMFQYATARRLADARKTKLYIDASWFETAKNIDTPRTYELGCFNIQERFISPNKLLLVDNNEKRSLKRKVYLHTKAALKTKVHPYKEEVEKFHKEVFWLPDNTFLEGFWQCENYFVGARDIILKDFSFKKPPTGKNKELLKEIESSNAVSLHVRRGDYANIKTVTQFHGLMGLDYYKKAIELIAKQVKNPHFFVFSDEPEWCKKNLKIDYPTTYVSHNKDGSEDMRLMSHCKHHIIANSSFSWWGAWLNPRKDKIVYAPKVWFQVKHPNAKDVVPKSWQRI